jgi:hypothetical protein
MGAVRNRHSRAEQGFDGVVHEITRLGVAMNDLLYIGLTIVIFALLILLVKGVEHFER